MDKLIEKIEAMIRMEELQPEKDAAGSYRPEGVEARVRVNAYKDCLRLAKEVQEA